jgi:hypothetical protein
MSKVTIAGDVNGTGVFTIASPNGNTNRTLTLPDVTATVITDSAGVLNIGAGQIYKDAGGNVGIGTSAPTAKLEVAGTGTQQINVRAQTSGDAVLYLEASGVNAGEVGYLRSGQALYFKNGGVERARIDSSGRLLIGQTASAGNDARLQVTTGSANAAQFIVTSGNFPIVASNNGSGSGLIYFNYNNGNVGTITTTGTSVAYNTTSDYRLKNTIAPMTGALDKVALLKPCTYKWNADGSDGQGFIAHELAEVEPGCVSGEKDAVDAEGKPKYQGIDTSFLVATLTAAIQELKAIVDAQGAEIASLKGASA